MLLERLLDNLALSVDAFATCRVAEGWRLRLPALEWVTFHYVARGEGALTDADGRTLALPAGALAVVPPHLIHSLQCGIPPFGEVSVGGGRTPVSELGAHLAGPTEEDALVVVCGRVDVTYGGGLGLFDQLREVLVLDFSEDPQMRATFESMLEEAQSGRPGSRAMTSTLMRGCLIRVFRELCEHDECTVPWLSALDDPALAPVVDAMLAHPEDPHSVESLAKKAYMSRSVFARRFRQSFGQPPHEYLRGIRLRHAAKLLKRSPPLGISTVGSRSGFASRSQFSRAFSGHFGLSPTEFRETGPLAQGG
jgi:AraC family transcriptional activator of mtrCDE